MKTLIHTTPNATVTITKGTTVKTKQADDNGDALFSVSVGTWNVKCALDGAEITGQIVVSDTIEYDLPIGTLISKLPLNSKILLGGKGFQIVAFDHADYYPANTVTLFSETILNTQTYGSNVNWNTSNVRTWLNDDFYNTLNESEKSAIVTTTVKTMNSSSVIETTQDNFFIPCINETGYEVKSGEGSPIGIQSMLAVGAQWYTRSWYSATPIAPLMYEIRMDGNYDGNANVLNPIGVRPLTNLSKNTLLSQEPNEQGYYTIKEV